jgi:ankyrin repeat protein
MSLFLAVVTTACGKESLIFFYSTMKVGAATQSFTPGSLKNEEYLELPQLHEAVRSRNEAYVEWLIRHKADVNEQIPTGKTPLHFAVLSDNLSMTRLLIQNGARTDIKDRHGKTPLDYWESGGNLEILRLLMER